MRGGDEEAGTRLVAAGWHPGAIAGREALDRLDIEGFDLAVIVSQDCDLAQADEIEPDLELLLGHTIESMRSDCRYGRNPRALDLEVPDAAGGLCACAFRVRDRRLVPKESFAANSGSTAGSLTPASTSQLVRWLARRYTRPAWPDAFNERLKSVDARLERLFKSEASAVISGIWLRLEPDAELPEGEAYELDAWLTVAEEDLADRAGARAAQGFEQGFRDIVGSCPGIALLECELRNEHDVTLADLRVLRRLDRDYRSFAAKPGGRLPPDE